MVSFYPRNILSRNQLWDLGLTVDRGFWFRVALPRAALFYLREQMRKIGLSVLLAITITTVFTLLANGVEYVWSYDIDYICGFTAGSLYMMIASKRV